jgi:membrane-associated phospholipid phosphatase
VLLVAYLAVTLVFAVAAGRGGGAVAAHLAPLAMVLLVYFLAERSSFGPLVHWVPLLLVPVLYGALASLVSGGGVGVHDAAVIGWEEALFGGQPSRTLALALPSRALSELLHLCYLSFYAIIFVPPIALALARRWEPFDDTVFAVTLAFTSCFAMFVAFPVEGPRYLGPPPGIPIGPVRSFVLGVLERFSSRGTAFPSSHVAVAVAQSITALRLQARVGIVVAVLTVGLAIGAVYGGFHYAVDVLAGAALGAAIAVGTPRLRRALRARLG